MGEQILKVFLYVHVFAGFLAAFVAFPVAALATKGSRLHAAAGWTFVGCFFFLCAGGYILEFEYLKSTVVDVFGIEMNVSPFNKRTDPEAVINTAMVNTIALYFALSGWRVWRRAPQSEVGRYPMFDSILAVAGLLAGGTFFATLWFAIDRGAIDATDPSFVWEGHAIIAAASAYVFFDAGKDLWIGVARRPPKAWWRIHARKMIAAQMGLAAAFPYRCVPFSRLGGFLMLVAMVVALVFGVIVARRFGAMLRAQRAGA